MLELDRRLELALALPRNAVRMGEKFDPTLLPSALDPLVAVFVDGQEVVPQFLIGFRHVFDRSHGGELQLELAELFLVVIVLVRFEIAPRAEGFAARLQYAPEGISLIVCLQMGCQVAFLRESPGAAGDVAFEGPFS